MKKADSSLRLKEEYVRREEKIYFQKRLKKLKINFAEWKRIYTFAPRKWNSGRSLRDLLVGSE